MQGLNNTNKQRKFETESTKKDKLSNDCKAQKNTLFQPVIFDDKNFSFMQDFGNYVTVVPLTADCDKLP